jgi:exodeoxyribonuclease VII large subunit
MPEKTSDRTIFSLLEVSQSIQKSLAERYTSAYWIKAEMNKLNYYSHSGHCYPELLDKIDGKVVAQMKCNLWKDDYQRINERFLSTLKEPLKDGIKILFLGKIGFDPVYGLSIRILDIDVSYTLGDIEKEKMETIMRLKAEGLFDKNKKTTLPLLPKRIAMISVESSKGYADFMEVLNHNAWGYRFFHMLFPSLLQGDKAVVTMIEQLNVIRKVIHHFDVVAIVRGGGGDVGLSCYNHYDLARAIAEFPIPVITGIGHATNETVSEMISFQNAITPTKIAEYLIQQFHNFAQPVEKAREKMVSYSRELIETEKIAIAHEAKVFRSATSRLLQGHRSAIREQVLGVQSNVKMFVKINRDELNESKNIIQRGTQRIVTQNKEDIIRIQQSVQPSVNRFLQDEINKVQQFEKDVKNLSPENVLRRGFSITLINGKAARFASDIKPGDTLETHLYKGEIESEVKKVKPSNENE